MIIISAQEEMAYHADRGDIGTVVNMIDTYVPGVDGPAQSYSERYNNGCTTRPKFVPASEDPFPLRRKPVYRKRERR